MAAQTSWLREAPAVNHSVSIEIEDAALAKSGLDSDEHYSSGLPRIVGNSAAFRRVLGIVGVVARAATSLPSNVEPRSEREIIEAALAETRGRVSGPSGTAAKPGVQFGERFSTSRSLKNSDSPGFTEFADFADFGDTGPQSNHRLLFLFIGLEVAVGLLFLGSIATWHEVGATTGQATMRSTK